MHNKQRNKDFCLRCLEVYRDMERMGTDPELRDVVTAAIATAPRSFYVDTEYAYNKMCTLLRRREIPEPRTPRERMWEEMRAMVVAERARRRCTMARALGYVLNFCHPSEFPLTVDQGMCVAGEVFERRTVHRPRRAATERRTRNLAEL